MTDYETPEMPDTCYCSSNGECKVCEELLEQPDNLDNLVVPPSVVEYAVSMAETYMRNNPIWEDEDGWDYFNGLDLNLCVNDGELTVTAYGLTDDGWGFMTTDTSRYETIVKYNKQITKETNMSNNYNQQTDIEQIARIATLTSDVNRLTKELEQSEAGWAASEVEWVSVQNRSTENFQSLKRHNKDILHTVRNFIMDKASEDIDWIDDNSEFIDAMVDAGMDGLQKTVTVSRSYMVTVEVTAKVDWDWDGSDEDSYIDLELDEDDIGGSLLENCNDSDISVEVSERYSERSCDITTDTDK